MKFYNAIASALQARANCVKSGNNTVWHAKHGERIEALIRMLDWDRSTPEKLVFRADFHHMDDNGFYDGWGEYSVIVRASLVSVIDIRVTGDRREIKEYIAEVFNALADIEVPR